MVGNPRAPSVVSRVCKPKPAGRIHADLIGAVNPRTVSPSIHHCSTSFLELCGFFPASALLPHEALRPPGAEDARCVQPTSATQTTCVHPHPVRSRLLSRLSSWGHPAESKALRGSTGGPNGSRRLDRFGGLSLTQPRRSSPLVFASFLWLHSLGDERGRFLPTVRGSIEPLTSLSRLPVHHVAHVAFARASSFVVLLGERSK